MTSTCTCLSRSRCTGRRPDVPVRRPLPLGMATPWRLRILVLLRCLRRRDPGRGPLWHRGLLAGAQLPRPGVLASGLAPASGPWASGLLPTSPRRRSRVPPCPLAPSEGLHEEAPNFRVPPVSAVTTASTAAARAPACQGGGAAFMPSATAPACESAPPRPEAR